MSSGYGNGSKSNWEGRQYYAASSSSTMTNNDDRRNPSLSRYHDTMIPRNTYAYSNRSGSRPSPAPPAPPRPPSQPRVPYTSSSRPTTSTFARELSRDYPIREDALPNENTRWSKPVVPPPVRPVASVQRTVEKSYGPRPDPYPRETDRTLRSYQEMERSSSKMQWRKQQARSAGSQEQSSSAYPRDLRVDQRPTDQRGSRPPDMTYSSMRSRKGKESESDYEDKPYAEDRARLGERRAELLQSHSSAPLESQTTRSSALQFDPSGSNRSAQQRKDERAKSHLSQNLVPTQSSIHLNRLAADMTEAEIVKGLSSFGKIVSVDLRNSKFKPSKKKEVIAPTSHYKLAFVHFESSNDAAKALQELQSGSHWLRPFRGNPSWQPEVLVSLMRSPKQTASEGAFEKDGSQYSGSPAPPAMKRNTVEQVRKLQERSVTPTARRTLPLFNPQSESPAPSLQSPTRVSRNDGNHMSHRPDDSVPENRHSIANEASLSSSTTAASLVDSALNEAPTRLTASKLSAATFTESIVVPETLRGFGMLEAKRRNNFMLQNLHRVTSLGKKVISQSYKDDQLIFTFVHEDDESALMAGVGMEEKPVLASDDMEESVARALPQPLDPPLEDIKAVFFPNPILHKPANSTDIRRSVHAFIKEFFDHFDTYRASLASFYTEFAKFSVRVVTEPPSRLRQLPVQFSQRLDSLDKFVTATGKLFITPEPIVNAIKNLPAGSHNLAKILFDVTEVPDLRKSENAKDAQTVFVILHGDFEIFPGALIRSFRRTWLLIPRNPSNRPGPSQYVIEHDQLVIMHHVPEPVSPLKQCPPIGQGAVPGARQGREVEVRPPRARRLDGTEVTSLPSKRQKVENSHSDSEDDIIIVDSSSSRHVVEEALSPSPIAGDHPSSPPALVFDGGRPLSETTSAQDLPSVSASHRIVPRQPATRVRASSVSSEGEAESSAEALIRRRQRQSTVALEMDTDASSLEKLKRAGDEISWESINALVKKQVRQALMDNLAQRNTSGSAARLTHVNAASTEKKTTSKEAVVAGSARKKNSKEMFLTAGASDSRRHGFNGKSNKMRSIAQQENGKFLGMTSVGDIVEWDGTSSGEPPKRLYSNPIPGDRVEDFTYDAVRDRLIVGYMCDPGKKEMSLPMHQVRIFSRHKDQMVSASLRGRPHEYAGVSAIAQIPARDGVSFITAGPDKKMFLWRKDNLHRDPASIVCEHTAKINSLVYAADRKWIISGGADKRMIAYDLAAEQAVHHRTLRFGLTSVSTVPSHPQLILCRMWATEKQFSLQDLRSKEGVVAEFGFPLATTTSGTSNVRNVLSLGRFFKGSFRDHFYAHPDNETGIKIWDIRALKRGKDVVQSLPGVGRSRIKQTLFVDRDRMALVDASNFTMLQLKNV